MIKVSVIVPVYNVERYVANCLQSICIQTLKDIEIICIDDGSTDSSGKILDAFKANDNRITVIHKENGGLSSTRNIGLQMAKGEYVAFIDSDDAIDREYLEALYTTAKINCLDICAADMIAFELDAHAPQLTFYQFLRYDRKLDVAHKIQDKYKLAQMPQFNYVINKIYKREPLVKSGIIFEEGVLFEDIEWSHKVMYYLGAFGIARPTIHGDVAYYYGQRTTSIVATKSEKWLKDRAHVHRKTIDFLQSLPHDFGNMRDYDWTAMKTYKLCGITLLKIRTCGLYKLYYLFDKFLIFEIHEKRNEHD